MTPDTSKETSSAAVATTLEDDFVSPLTAIRGSLEVLRDTPDIAADDRGRFIDIGLRACARLEQAISALADTVYASAPAEAATAADPERRGYLARIAFLHELQVLDLDFSDYLFDSSQAVHHFFDVIDEAMEESGRQWYMAVNFRNCKIWPEAWVAYAYRGKQLNTLYALAAVRYAAPVHGVRQVNRGKLEGLESDPFPSRDAALAALAKLRGQASSQ